MAELANMDPDALRELANYRMPFGKYRGTRLLDLPEAYVLWFRQKGFPKGKLGTLLASVYEIKLNGLERLLDPFRANGPGKPGKPEGQHTEKCPDEWRPGSVHEERDWE